MIPVALRQGGRDPRPADVGLGEAVEQQDGRYSRAPAGGARGEGYSKREIARELVALMATLGHERVAVVGHDRGARVGYRMALDEDLIGAAPGALLDHALTTWAGDPAAVPADHRAAYLAAMTPATIAAMCADYRSSFHLDRRHDADDRGRRRISAPVLVITGADETQLADAPRVWAAWAEDLTATRVPGGHFLPEEAPDAHVDALGPFLAVLGR
jgi:haloacetate dehalogenase